MTKSFIDHEYLDTARKNSAAFVNDARYLLENFLPHEWRNDYTSEKRRSRESIIAYVLYNNSINPYPGQNVDRILEVAEYLEITPEQLLGGAKLPDYFGQGNNSAKIEIKPR